MEYLQPNGHFLVLNSKARPSAFLDHFPKHIEIYKDENEIKPSIIARVPAF